MNNTISNTTLQNALLVNPHTGQEFALGITTITIGRSHDNNIVLASDKSVSRLHAVIHYVDGKYYIDDASSTNGTCVNGLASKKRTLLNSGDEIRLGVTRLLFLSIPNRQSKYNDANHQYDESRSSAAMSSHKKETALEHFFQMKLQTRLNPAV